MSAAGSRRDDTPATAPKLAAMTAPAPVPQDASRIAGDAASVGGCDVRREDGGRTLVVLRRPERWEFLPVGCVVWCLGLLFLAVALQWLPPPRAPNGAVLPNPANDPVFRAVSGSLTAFGAFLTVFRRRAFEEVRLGPDGLTYRGRGAILTTRREVPLNRVGPPVVRTERWGGRKRIKVEVVHIPDEGDPNRPVRIGGLWVMCDGHAAVRTVLADRLAGLRGER